MPPKADLKKKLSLLRSYLPEKPKNLKLLVMDMGRSYASAITAHLPKFDTVFDRHHIMVQMNLAIESLCREQQNTIDKSE